MALNFLSGLLPTKASGGNIMSTLPSILGMLQQGKQDKLFKQLLSAGASPEERYAISMQKALAEPNNSYVKSIQDEEFQALMNAINQGIQGKVLSDRREAAMGRRPTFFDPERADENISYQLSRGAPQAMLQARENAFNRIAQAAGGVGSYAPASEKRQYARLGAQQDRMDYQSQAYPKMLQQIMQVFNRGQTGQSIPNRNIAGTRYML